MDNLIKPATYRLLAYQDAWLARQAEKDGHTKKVNILRRLIDQAIQREDRPAKKGVRA